MATVEADWSGLAKARYDDRTGCLNMAWLAGLGRSHNEALQSAILQQIAPAMGTAKKELLSGRSLRSLVSNCPSEPLALSVTQAML